MRAVSTAGELAAVECAVPKLAALLTDAVAGELTEVAAGATVRVVVEAGRRPFGGDGWTHIGRGVWAAGSRVLITDACSSGFDLLVQPDWPTLQVTARYRAAPRTRAANMLLASRFRLLAAQTLVHYPVLWWASLRGRVPLHVSVTAGGGGVTMIAGPSGVGKSTLLAAGLPHGEIATADNVCACDTVTAYGLVEPLRVEPGASPGDRRDGNGRGAGRPGPAAPHGRRERPLPARAASLEPDRIVVLRRAHPAQPTTVAPLSARQAARELVTGTYMAGELRRFWPFAAALALATGLGPPHPEVTRVAGALAERLPCLEIRVAHGSRAPLAELLSLASVR